MMSAAAAFDMRVFTDSWGDVHPGSILTVWKLGQVTALQLVVGVAKRDSVYYSSVRVVNLEDWGPSSYLNVIAHHPLHYHGVSLVRT